MLQNLGFGVLIQQDSIGVTPVGVRHTWQLAYLLLYTASPLANTSIEKKAIMITTLTHLLYIEKESPKPSFKL
jgi:hypothetical protein